MTLSYIEQMNRINADELLEGLAAHGLFADKIPPFLSAESFFNFAKNNFNNKKTKPSNGYIQYESTRNINIPRILGIPNPILYFQLCECLSNHWEKLKEHFKNNTQDEKFKISRIHIRKINKKMKIFEMGSYSEKIEKKSELFEMSFKDYKEDDNPIPAILIGKRFVVNADISNCFGSIYTHALSWALVGKDKAKIERKDHWHSNIDECARNLNNGETHGILIGCHASNLLSELILVVIDKKLRDLGYEYIRNIDDYNCYVESFEQAEKFLIELSNELKKFGLSLNHKKTKIEQLPLSVSTQWIRKLKKISNKEFINYNDMQQFLDVAIELMAHNSDNAAIMNYAIKIINKKKMSRTALSYYIDMINHLVLIYPYLISLLDEYLFKLGLDVRKIKDITQSIYDLGIKNKINELISYALYFSIKYNFSLKEDPFEKTKDVNDCIVLLLSFLYDKRLCDKLTDTKLKRYRSIADRLYNNGDGMDEFWLFIYEVFSNGKFPNDSDWKKMKENNISFIKNEFSKFRT